MVWPLAMVARHRPRALLNGLLLLLVLLGANSWGGAQRVFGGGPAPPSTAPATKISLPPEPPLVLAALQGLLRESNPQLVMRIDSVAVKYVTDKAFWYSIASAWKTGNRASCGTGSEFAPSTAMSTWLLCMANSSGAPSRAAPRRRCRWRLTWCLQ